MKPKISIIVPVYNVEEYLEDCLDSIAAQTFINFECICIDDGSTDNSGSILDEYAKKDNRFIILHQKNAGVSAARNAGLEAAQGEWIVFVDSDDYIDKKTYETAFQTAIEDNADIVFFGINCETRNGIIKIKSPYNQKLVCKKQEFINEFSYLRRMENAIYFHSPCNKFYKRKSLSNVRFYTRMKGGEDYVFNLHIFNKSNKVVFIPDVLYTYRYNRQSATKTSIAGKQTAIDALCMANETIKFCNENKVKKNKSIDTFLSYQYSALLQAANTMKNKKLQRAILKRIKLKHIFCDIKNPRHTLFMLCSCFHLHFVGTCIMKRSSKLN